MLTSPFPSVTISGLIYSGLRKIRPHMRVPTPRGTLVLLHVKRLSALPASCCPSPQLRCALAAAKFIARIGPPIAAPAIVIGAGTGISSTVTALSPRLHSTSPNYRRSRSLQIQFTREPLESRRSNIDRDISPRSARPARTALPHHCAQSRASPPISVRTVTVAPGTTAPDLSTTVPTISARPFHDPHACCVRTSTFLSAPAHPLHCRSALRDTPQNRRRFRTSDPHLHCALQNSCSCLSHRAGSKRNGVFHASFGAARFLQRLKCPHHVFRMLPKFPAQPYPQFHAPAPQTPRDSAPGMHRIFLPADSFRTPRPASLASPSLSQQTAPSRPYPAARSPRGSIGFTALSMESE